MWWNLNKVLVTPGWSSSFWHVMLSYIRVYCGIGTNFEPTAVNHLPILNAHDFRRVGIIFKHWGQERHQSKLWNLVHGKCDLFWLLTGNENVVDQRFKDSVKLLIAQEGFGCGKDLWKRFNWNTCFYTWLALPCKHVQQKTWHYRVVTAARTEPNLGSIGGQRLAWHHQWQT